ncbi:MAG: bifunctional diaminohydroxyphosphoribosylaminopyrimidine deaminase/5-amino-6-(5-phosphoribosylamino)uracil reductase RibD [Myxococcales bacterium]|nr:bifunctional diaminohydroxyphosphoribosylaminopyrimidine deaminase/5-amino-6-(5-phosphoribosylamino)uracil reductase RibD [Myxococcales bacterium]
MSTSRSEPPRTATCGTDSDDLDGRAMRAAIDEAEKARGSTGNNPWVGCVIANAAGEVLAEGHTQGPGEDHAEIVALRRARERGVELSTCTMYSTLEPCSFHGRTPACSRTIVEAGFKRVVTGIRDPNPRVDGLGVRYLRDAGIDVIEGVGAQAITRQLAEWIFRCHPHEPLRRASALMLAPNATRVSSLLVLTELYGLEASVIERILDQLGKR